MSVLDARQPARFVRPCTGFLLTPGRRSVTRWLRGCGVGRDFRRYYYLLGGVSRKAPGLAVALLRILHNRLPGGSTGRSAIGWQVAQCERNKGQ